jgi:hypothetical protein
VGQRSVNDIIAKRMNKKQQMRWNKATVRPFLPGPEGGDVTTAPPPVCHSVLVTVVISCLPLRKYAPYLMTTPLRKNQIQQVALFGRCRDLRRLSCGVAMTDSRWELTIVTLVTITVFFSVGHVVKPLIHSIGCGSIFGVVT